MRALSFCSLLFIICLSIGCKKDSGGGSSVPPADSPSDIQISTPIAGTIVLNGFNLTIAGSIADNDVLSSAMIQIINKNNAVVLFQQTLATGNVTFYNFQWNWMVSGISAQTPATIRITAKDKYAYTISKEVDIVLDN